LGINTFFCAIFIWFCGSSDNSSGATSGELTDWLESPKSTLAYVILIDQFFRNLYRNTPQMFAHDALALNGAKQIIENGG
jgi:uncharacterized protein (DUF924 family)